MRRFLPVHWLALASLFPLALFADDAPKVEQLYQANCASCHGANLEGGSGLKLTDDEWKHGGSDEEIAASIAQGYPLMGMIGWEKTLNPAQIRSLVIYIREKGKEAAAGKLALPKPDFDKPVATQKAAYRLQKVADGLHDPWALAFLPDGRMLVTEKAGTLRLVAADGTVQPDPVRDTPPVTQLGQGGLLDVALHPDYAKNGWIYLSLADGFKDEAGKDRALTAVVRGHLKGGAWVDQEWIWRGDRKFYSGAGVHFGSRFVFDQGYVYFVVGERGGGLEAQDVKRPNGKIYRLFDDGRIPPDNPFVGQEGAEPGIWTYGHRNPQGLTKDPRDGSIWDTEHGPRGGDEFNHIVKGANYGWPVITYGMDYSGKPMPNSEGTAHEGMRQPEHFWVPSIAPSGLAIYTGDQFPDWKYDYFAGSLKAQELHRLHVENGKVTGEEIVLKGIGRIRDVVSGPDGLLYLVLNQPDMIVKLVPAAVATGEAKK